MSKRTHLTISEKKMKEIYAISQNKEDFYFLESFRRCKNNLVIKEIFNIGLKEYLENKKFKFSKSKKE